MKDRKTMMWTLLIVAALCVGVFALKQSSLVGEDKAVKLLRGGAQVVDVRSPGEFGSGHLPGAVNIPLGEVGQEVPRRFPDKGQALLLHCVSGARSGMAARQLKSLGYANVFNLGSYGRAEKLISAAKSQ